MMMAKITTPCPPPPQAPGHLVSVSRQTVKSCGASLKTLHRPKSCESFQGGLSPWWRTRSRERGGGVEVAPEVEVLRRRQQWRKPLGVLSMNPTKTIHHRALTAKLKWLFPRTQTLSQIHLCPSSRSEVILLTPPSIILLTCRC